MSSCSPKKTATFILFCKRMRLNLCQMSQRNKLGRWGEDYVADYLQAYGYKILHRNWHFYHLEIDIVAQQDDVLAIVEVKTRSNTIFEHPQEAVNNIKICRLIEAADAYVKQFNIALPVRFDIVTIVTHNGQRLPEIDLIQDAFYPTDASYD